MVFSGKYKTGEQILRLANERFAVPEMLFHPADIGIQEMGISEAIVDSIQSLPEGQTLPALQTQQWAHRHTSCGWLQMEGGDRQVASLILAWGLTDTVIGVTYSSVTECQPFVSCCQTCSLTSTRTSSWLEGTLCFLASESDWRQNYDHLCRPTFPCQFYIPLSKSSSIHQSFLRTYSFDMNLRTRRQKLCWTYLKNILNLLLQPNLLPMGRRKAAGPQSRLRWDRGDTRGLRRKRTLHLWRKVWYLTELKGWAADFSATSWTWTQNHHLRDQRCANLPPVYLQTQILLQD